MIFAAHSQIQQSKIKQCRHFNWQWNFISKNGKRGQLLERDFGYEVSLHGFPQCDEQLTQTCDVFLHKKLTKLFTCTDKHASAHCVAYPIHWFKSANTTVFEGAKVAILINNVNQSLSRQFLSKNKISRFGVRYSSVFRNTECWKFSEQTGTKLILQRCSKLCRQDVMDLRQKR